MNKKLLVLSVAVVTCIFAAPMLTESINDPEMTLAESMKETQQDHEKIDQFITKANKQFHKKYDGKASVGYGFEKRIASVQVQNQQLADKRGKEMKSLIYHIADEIELDNISAKVRVVDYPDVEISKEDQALRERIDKVFKTSIKILKQDGFEAPGMQISSRNPNKLLEITLPFKAKLNENGVDELEEKIKHAISTKIDENIDVTVKKKTKKQMRDEEWGPIFNSIMEETNKKFEEYRGFAYSFYPDPLQIIIKTDLHESKWWRNSEEEVEEIVDYVEAIIKLKRKEIGVEKIPYKIIVRGKNNKQLN